MLNPNRFFHLADVHLGAPVERGKLPADIRGKISAAREQALLDVCETAKREEVGAVIIAGDLFHAAHGSRGLAIRASEILAAAAPVHVLIVPGNHDYWQQGGIWHDTNWPTNVCLYSTGAPEYYRPNKEGPMFWGVGWNRKEIKVSPVCAWPGALGYSNRKNVLILHGTLIGAQPADWAVYGGFHLENLPLEQFDYVALGHLHWYSSQNSNNRPPVVYSGALASSGWHDQGSNKWVDVTLTETGCTYQTRPSGAYEFRERTLSISEYPTEQDIIDAILTKQTDRRARIVDYVYLVGLIAPELKATIKGVHAFTKGEFGHLTLHDLTVPVDRMPDARKRSDAIYAFSRRIDVAIEDEPDPNRKRLLEEVREHGLVAAQAKTSTGPGRVYQ